MYKLLIILLLLLTIPVSSIYALTPAGTEIVNQSSITYRNASGEIVTVNSNQVTTLVLPVYGLTITPDGTVQNPGQSQNAVAGATVYFRYVLVNTGNDMDSYNLTVLVDPSSNFIPSSFRVFLDTNGNGVIDAGEADVTAVLPDVPYGVAVSLVIVYQIPLIAQPTDKAYITLNGSSVGDANQTDVNNFHLVNIVDDAVIVANKGATPLHTSAGGEITYTISGSNTGARQITPMPFNVGGTNYYGLLIADPLPKYNNVPFKVVSGTLAGTPVSGTIFYLVGGNPNVNNPISSWGGVWQTSYTDQATAVGFITGNTNANSGIIDPGQSFSCTFVVTVPIDHPKGTVDNIARVEYNSFYGTPNNLNTNVVTVTIGGDEQQETPAVMVGPLGNPTAHDLGVVAEDTTIVDTISAAGYRIAHLTAFNAGNSIDILNIRPLYNPNKWVVTFYHPDGSTPLLDSNSDGLVDLGVVDPKAEKNFIAKIAVPSDYPPSYDEIVVVEVSSSLSSSNTVPGYVGTITGYISGSSEDQVTISDASVYSKWDVVNINHEVRKIINVSGNTITVSKLSSNPMGKVITGIIGVKNRTTVLCKIVTAVGLVYYNSPPANPDSVSKNGVAGGDVDFPLTIENPARINDTYTLSHNIPSLWTVRYYLDDNGDGLPDNLTPISSIPVKAGAKRTMVARVFIPSSATIGTYPINYIATSTNNVSLIDQFTDYVIINPAPSALLEPDRSGTGLPGYTIIYYHQLINTGNTVLPTSSYFVINSHLGWNYILFQADPNNPGEFTQLSMGPQATYLLAYEVPMGKNSAIRATAFIPSNSVDGTVETAVITFVGQGVAQGVSNNVTDITTVITGNIYQEKRVINISTESDTSWENGVDYNEGLPGQYLKYFVNYKNIGTSNVDLIYVFDAIPANTVYVPNSAKFEIGTGTIEFSVNGGLTWQTTEPIATSITNIRWRHANGGVLQPGESGRVSFKVVIK